MIHGNVTISKFQNGIFHQLYHLARDFKSNYFLKNPNQRESKKYNTNVLPARQIMDSALLSIFYHKGPERIL